MSLKKVWMGCITVAAAFSLFACTGSQNKDVEQSGKMEQSVESKMESGMKEETMSGDAKTSDEEKSKADDGMSKKKVVLLTSFLNDMAMQIAGDTVEYEMIIPAGEDPHLYIAKPDDNRKIMEADMVFYHGLHFEGKMVDVLEQVGVPVSKNFPEEKLNNMEEDGETIVDPHFWFDLELYKMAVDEMSTELIKLNPEYETMYKENTLKYQKELDDLDAYIKGRVEELPKESRYLITPHDAFNYFARSYGMEVKAPQGVSTDSEVATSDIQSTVDFILEHKIKAVFVESTTDPARMQKLKEGAAAKGFELTIVSGEGKELFSDSLAPVGEDGDTFVEMYKHNIDLIVDHLKE